MVTGSARNDEAIAVLEDLLQGTPESTVAEAALYRLGRIAADREHWAKVTGPFKTLVERFPASAMRPEVEFWLAEAAYRRGNYEEAANRFSKITYSDEDADWMATAWLRPPIRILLAPIPPFTFLISSIRIITRQCVCMRPQPWKASTTTSHFLLMLWIGT